MNTSSVNIIAWVAALLILGGCSTTSVQPPNADYGAPIMSAEDVKSMIHVEVSVLEPIEVDETILASTD